VCERQRLGACADSARGCVRLSVRCAVVFAALSVFVTAAAGPADAQSFLGALFGWGEAPARTMPPARSIPPAHETAPLHEGGSARFDHAARSRDGDIGSYQTMCVRTCDGYYWPLHYPANRGDFKADEALCQATCGAATKLYTRADPGVETEEMVDGEGRSYGSSPTAFAYRKGLINGCTCRPMPWSIGERARHETYALIEEEKKLRAEQADAERAAAVAAVLGSAHTWGVDVTVAAFKSGQGEARAVALLSPGPQEFPPVGGVPAIGPLEEALLLKLRDTSGAALPDEAVQALDAGDKAQPALSVAATAGLHGRRVAVEAAAQRPGQGLRGPRVRVASASGPQHKPGVFAWLAGPSKFTYPGDPPGR